MSRSARASRGGRRGQRWLTAVVILLAAAVVAVRLERWIQPVTAEVFFVRYQDGRGTLVPVRHPVSRGGAEERVSRALRDLLAGPSPDERRRGLVSEIPPGTGLRGVRVGRGVISVDLTSAFGGGGGSTSMLARVWQVVYTASQVPSAPEVQILLDGQRIQALGGEGLLIGRPLRRPPAMPVF